jgi:hypothetical protein
MAIHGLLTAAIMADVGEVAQIMQFLIRPQSSGNPKMNP